MKPYDVLLGGTVMGARAAEYPGFFARLGPLQSPELWNRA